MLLAESPIGDQIKDSLYAFTPQLVSILLTFITITTLCIIYNVKIRNVENREKLSGFLILTEMFIVGLEDLIVSVMGKKYRKLTPYAMYIILYIFISCLFSLLGFESAMTSLTVTFSMAFVTFIGIYYFGLKYQKLAFFKKYINPLELITQFVPLLSMAFRLFGNILAGSIILGLFYAFFIGVQAGFSGDKSALLGINEAVKKGWLNNDIWNVDPNHLDLTWKAQYTYFWSGINIFTTAFGPFLHIYFDLFEGMIQAFVFVILTVSYWGDAMGEEHEEEPERRQSSISGVSKTDKRKPQVVRI
ncbi:F0F1 ATP synthase subunit A [Spiroplasma sabaudiense Ar-1343]|uniref:F0F1 ATP synthase subunit A n=1 Tax=Spiroplasma sabaudiense Ar-1343 TaxID=1276257 RepID=W6A991_9MOLU|nr:F0F1 ATP synthase subunit A [Spiroplasma sabaudiense]AHI53460.1 F0F1 ATP synthase subunit A [Spiroplasma sabaudiense Ar-1343]